MDCILFKDCREYSSLAIEATVKNQRMTVKVSLHFMRLYETVAQYALAMELAGRMTAETVLTGKALSRDKNSSATVRAAVLKVLSLWHHINLALLNLKVSKILLALTVLELKDVATTIFLKLVDNLFRDYYATDLLLNLECVHFVVVVFVRLICCVVVC